MVSSWSLSSSSSSAAATTATAILAADPCYEEENNNDDYTAEYPDALVSPLLPISPSSSTVVEDSSSSWSMRPSVTPYGPRLGFRSMTTGPGLGTTTTAAAASTTTTTSAPTPATTMTTNASLPSMLFWCVLNRLLRLKSVATAILPSPLNYLVSNGKFTAWGYVGFHVILATAIFPFWFLSHLITEWGVYFLILSAIFGCGRAILVFVAFPGSSPKLITELQFEFGKYALRMLEAALEAVKDVASTFLLLQKPHDFQHHLHSLPNLWKRAVTFRNRVLVVFANVLMALYHQIPNNTNPHRHSNNNNNSQNKTDSCLDEYGNNRLDATLLDGDTPPKKSNVGNLHSLSDSAKWQGRQLLQRLQKLILALKTMEEKAIQPILLLPTLTTGKIQPEALASAQQVWELASSLQEFCQYTLRQPFQGLDDNDDENKDDDDNNNNTDQNNSIGDDQARRSVFRRPPPTNSEQQATGGSIFSNLWEALVSGWSSRILPWLDPDPHPSIFGLDMLRGCVLSRYKGARQFWVPRRYNQGQLDVLYFPALSTTTTSQQQQSKPKRAVLYCNPNAGLAEVATGMRLVGSGTVDEESFVNIANAPDASWTDFYIHQLDMDVYLFNYAGFGRSFGSRGGCWSWFSPKNPSDWNPTTATNNVTAMDEEAAPLEGSVLNQKPTCFSRLGRILHSFFLSFQPRPETLRDDGIAVAEFIFSHQGVDQLLIHGESIGGMTAAGIARHFSDKKSKLHPQPFALVPTQETNNPTKVVSLLVCDRTFCNLEAVAQRLIGSWTGYAIRVLTFFSQHRRWNTNVAQDFLTADCPKIVAQDAADSIIADAASLKSGIALWKELHPNSATAHSSIAWMRHVPLRYRMADFENASVNNGKYTSSSSSCSSPCLTKNAATSSVVWQAPVWPTDKHVTTDEAVHFAACCRRIGKVATQKKREMALRFSSVTLDDGCTVDNKDTNNDDDLDGLTTSRMTPCVVQQAWMTLAACDGLVGSPLGAAVKRGLDDSVAWLCATLVFGGQVLVATAKERRRNSNMGTTVTVDASHFDQRSVGNNHPIPIPEVAERMEQILRDHASEFDVVELKHELQYTTRMLRYIQNRLCSPTCVKDSIQSSLLKRPTISTSSLGSSSDLEQNLPDDIHDEDSPNQVGCFLKLTCGHNSAFSVDERGKLKELVQMAYSI